MSTPTLAPPDVRPRQSVLALARIESWRLLRHPIFVVSVVLWSVWLVDASLLEPEPSLARFSETWSILTAFFLGIGGFVAMHRLTRSTQRATDVVEAVPLNEPARGLALCLTCLLPMALAVFGGLAWVAWIWSESWPPGYYSVLDTADRWSYHVAAVLAALGGPLLGVAVGRWWRWPMAGALTAVLLVAWCVSTGITTSGFWTTLHHNAAPFALAFTADSAEINFRQAGSIPWRVPYVVALCALAGLAAVAHGATGRLRRRLVAASLVTGGLALGFLLLATLTGPTGAFVTP